MVENMHKKKLFHKDFFDVIAWSVVVAAYMTFLYMINVSYVFTGYAENIIGILLFGLFALWGVLCGLMARDRGMIFLKKNFITLCLSMIWASIVFGGFLLDEDVIIAWGGLFRGFFISFTVGIVFTTVFSIVPFAVCFIISLLVQLASTKITKKLTSSTTNV
jgi:hypothetical protein